MRKDIVDLNNTIKEHDLTDNDRPFDLTRAEYNSFQVVMEHSSKYTIFWVGHKQISINSKAFKAYKVCSLITCY